MKNKLFYLIGVTCLLSYTGTFTSCVNGVDDEYLEQQISGGNGESGEGEGGEELPDLNGDYGQGKEYDLVMTCNGEVLNGKSISLAADENNETATLILAGAETDLETVISDAIPGGFGGLISGMGLKFMSNSPIPGEKEVTITNISLYKNGTGTSYKFEGESVQPTFTIAYRGTIEDEKLNIDLNYELTNQKLAGKWGIAPEVVRITGDKTEDLSPLWVSFDSNVKISAGIVKTDLLPLNLNNRAVNGIMNLLLGSTSGMAMGSIIGQSVGAEKIVQNMLEYIVAKPNGGMYASYSYGTDISKPGPYSQEMPHNAVRYYYDPENPDERIYLELNSGFLMDIIKQLAGAAAPASRSTRADIRDTAKELVALLVPLVKEGIPCDYKLEGDNLNINIDGVVLRDILDKLMIIINDPTSAEVVNGVLASLGDFKENMNLLLATLPNALKYADGDEKNGFTGECGYVKLGLKFVKK